MGKLKPEKDNTNSLISEEVLKVLFENAPDAYFMADIEGSFLYGNSATEKLIGQTRAELLGKNYIDIFLLSEKDISKALNLLLRSSRGLSAGPDEFELCLKDGSKKTVEIITHPVKVNDKYFILGLAKDITERKPIESKPDLINRDNAETALLLNAVLDAIPDIIGIQNLNHEIIMYNKAGYSFLQKSHEEVAGKKCYSLIGRDKICDICSTTECYKTKKAARHNQYFPELKMWIDMRSYPVLDDEGNIKYIIEHLRDITDIKEIENSLIENKLKAEESDRLKSAFLANMSHEIRTPMNGIMGFAELLKNPKLSGEERDDYLKIIQESGKRMLGILNDLIDVSKIESGQIVMNYTDVNINDLVKYVLSFFAPSAERKNLSLLSENTGERDIIICSTDREKLLAILTNLVSNAIKFTEEGSVSIGYTYSENLLSFYVKDTGPGISPDQKEKVFERFRQGSEGLTRNYEGAGLGLYISKIYSGMLGGDLTFINNNETIPGERGTTFTLTIPIIKPKEKIKKNSGPNPEQKVKSGPKDIKILICEDDEPSKLMLKVFLEPFSRELLFAETGKRAVELARENGDIDLILMDIKMAEMDGYEATMQIRNFNSKVIIIAQTAYAQAGDREKALNAGCNDYITKPLSREQLFRLINKYISTGKPGIII